jgi:predicted GH43/DUF377 family glycosyl hydrolase
VTRTPAHRIDAQLDPDPSRVVARLFLPSEQAGQQHSRVGAIADRVLALAESEVAESAAGITSGFGTRHRELSELLLHNASIVAARVQEGVELSDARRILLGASVTAEYATEAAALCNPSAVMHPDQSGLQDGQLRVAVSLRAIGEGHISSIAFCEAVVGPGPQWAFLHRDLPVVSGETASTRWSNDHFRAVLADQGTVDELGSSVLHELGQHFDAVDLERALVHTAGDLLTRVTGPTTVDLMRRVVSSAYRVDFPADTTLAQRILRPSAAEESDGMEDARFTRFTEPDGTVEYRATYTAYDGHQIAPRLLISPDLRQFRTYRLAGPAARNKGMALFPRLVDGRHLALCRTDGETISLASSPDGFTWSAPLPLYEPQQPWEVMQVGNCGPPIETDRGWLVLTHGVGPMRTYSIGAILLDLADPARVVGALTRPLLEPEAGEQDGYVPNVVYSCGALVHDGRVWLPYGIDDARIGVAWAVLADLLDELVASPPREDGPQDGSTVGPVARTAA